MPARGAALRVLQQFEKGKVDEDRVFEIALDAGADDFFNDDSQRGFLDAVAIDEALQRQRPLSRGRRGDHGFTDTHVR